MKCNDTLRTTQVADYSTFPVKQGPWAYNMPAVRMQQITQCPQEACWMPVKIVTYGMS